MAIQEFELDEIEEFPDEPEAPPDLLRSSEVIDAWPEAKAAIKKQMADEMARLRGSAEDIKDVSRVANVASGIEQSQQLIPRIGAAAADLYANSPFYKLAEAGIKKAVPSLSGELDVIRGMPQVLLQDFEKRNQQLTREQEALGVRDIPGQIIEGTTKAALELPVQMSGGAGAKGAQAMRAVAGGQGALGALTSYGEDRAKGKGVGESALYGGASGAITGLVTKAFGATGAESILRNEGVKGVANRILSVLKDAGMEGLEEGADTFYQDLLERITRNPNKPVAQSVSEMLMSAGIGSIIGGGAGSVAATMGESGIPEFDLESGKNAPPSPIEGGQNAIQPEGAPIPGNVREEPIQGVQEVPGEATGRAPDVGRSEEGSLSLAAAPEVAAPIKSLVDKIRTGGKFNNNSEAINAGLEAASVADLDALLQAKRELQSEAKKSRLDRAKALATGDEAGATAATDRGIQSVTKGQFLREAIESATSTGSHKVELRQFGEQNLPEPKLNWQKNPEVAAWLKSNGEELGLDTSEFESASLSSGRYDAVEPPARTDVDALINSLSKEHPGSAPVVVVENYHELPDSVHQSAYKQGANPIGVKGVLIGGKVYINRQMLESMEDVKATFFHEQAGHFATDKILGPKLNKFMESVFDSFQKTPLMQETQLLYKKGNKERWGREYVARLSENPQSDPGAWNKIVAMFRDWLRSIGWVNKVSDNDIRVLLNQSMESLRAKEDGRSPEDVSLSVGTPKGGDEDLEFTPLDPQSGTPTGELVGQGGQRRESQPEFQTSNKNRIVDEERKARGLPPMMAAERQSNQDAWDRAMQRVDARPEIQDTLINELISNPRAVTPEENAMLLQRRIELRNNYEKALQNWKIAFESGNMVKASEESQRVKNFGSELADLENVTKATGTQSGRSLQARKMEAREDYSLAKMELEAMQAKGRNLTPEEHMELIRAHDKIVELQSRIEELESTRESREVEKETDSAINAVKNDKSKDFDTDREEKLLGGIKAKVDKGQLSEITPDVQKLARVLWLRGFRTREPLIDELHNTLQTIIPGITRDETKRAFSGYGNFKPLSKEAIDVGLRDLRGQTQQVLKMEAIEGGRPLEKTGQERREPSDEERRLIKQVNELKRKFGVVVTDPATQLKSALQSRKTYYEHRIADLKHEIETRERIVKTKSASPTDPELQALIEEHERLKAEHEQIFVKPGMSDEQRLKMAIQAAERNLAHWEVRLNNAENGIFDRRQPGRKVTSPELEAIQAQAAAIREHVKELHDLANPKKTKEQIALQSLKTRMKNREAELRDRIARSDFSKKVKTPTKLDPEAQELKAKLDIAKEDYATKLEQDSWSKASVFEKGKTQAGRLYDAARAIMTTGELSFLLRQGKFQALSRPIQTLKTLPSTFKALFGSDEKVRQIEREILDNPLMEQARQDKLFIDEHQSSRLSRQDEIMMGQLVGKIPIVKNFNNAARVFLNKTRFDTWKALKNSLSPTGNAEVDRAEGRQIAKFVNEATGRGGLGKFEAAAVPLARIMFSPRYFASRLQMASGHSMWGGTNRTRKLIAAEYAKAIIGMGLYYALLKAYFSDDKDKTKGDIEIDPRSGNFGTVKVGKKSYIDPLAGLAQVATFAARTGTTAMNALTGGETPETKRQSGRMGRLRGDDYGQDRWTDVAKRFAMSKAHPVLGAVAGSLDGVDLVGNPTTPINEASKMVRPITYGDIYKAVKDEGVDHEAALTLVAILGEGVRTYEKKKK